MQHPFSVLEAEYTSMLARMQITRTAEINAVAKKLLRPEVIDKHIAVSQKTGVPAVWYAVAFEREASSNFKLALGQGDPWNQKSTHVPKGMGPFKSWEDAAIFYTNYDKLNDTSSPWSPAYACWKLEAWNGFGPRNHGRFTGYLWAGTQFYDPPTGKGGKYVADGVWSPTTVDKQLGCVPLFVTMIKMRPDLAFGAMPTNAVYNVNAPQPVPVGVGGGPAYDTLWIQHTINALGYEPPLVEDGSYGRKTRAAVLKFQQANKVTPYDGLVGPKTTAALKAALDAELRNV